MGVMANIIRNASRTSYQPLNIIVAPYDGLFELSLRNNTPHTFYLLNEIRKKQSEIKPISRLLYLNTNINSWPISLDFDLIICNDITDQINLCSQISKILHIPLLIIHHIIKPPFVKNEDIQILTDNYSEDTIVSMSKEINDSWCANHKIMPYYISVTEDDTKANCPSFIEAWNNLFNDLSQKPFLG